jgi:hypothetical protein
MGFPELKSIVNCHRAELGAGVSGIGGGNADGAAAARAHGAAAGHLISGLQLFAAFTKELDGHLDKC